MTSRPIERAVPAIIRMADSRSDAFRSAILISAIFLTCALVTLPTLVRLGWALPFSIPASFSRRFGAGRRLGDEGEGAVVEDRDHDRDDHPRLALGPRVELLAELHDVHAVRTQGRAHRRRRIRRPAGTLQLHDCRDLLRHVAPFTSPLARPVADDGSAESRYLPPVIRAVAGSTRYG